MREVPIPARRTVVIAALVIVVSALAASAAVVVLLRDDAGPARGELIAYSCKEPKNPWFAICVIRPDGEGRERLTARLRTSSPAWSPDGRRIAFTQNEDVGEFTTFTADDVFVIDADGDDPRQLTPERDGRFAGLPTWSPDGRRIAYVDGDSVATNVPSRLGGVFVMNDDGSERHRLMPGRLDTDPAWSPDGSEIAFARCMRYASALPRCSLELYVVDVDGGAIRRLTHTTLLNEGAPVWSPDGSRIAFATETPIDAPLAGTEGIYVMNRDGTETTLVLEREPVESGVYSLAWSPDGGTIAFETSPAFNCTAISLVDVESGAVRPLTTCARPSESSVAPAWQPDAAAEDR